MSDNSSSGGGGCGCITIVLFILLITLLFFGLPTPWGKLNLDLLPPQL